MEFFLCEEGEVIVFSITYHILVYMAVSTLYFLYV